MTGAASLFIVQLILAWSRSSAEDCSIDFGRGYDVMFILDKSQSISEVALKRTAEYLRLFIRKLLLIGPEPERCRLAFMSFFSHSFRISTPEKDVFKPVPIYESEFLAPGGVFSRETQPMIETTDTSVNKLGFLEAIKTYENIITSFPSRPKVLFLISDFHFDGSNKDLDVLRVQDAISELRKLADSQHTSLRLFGVGIGAYFNKTIMDLILKGGDSSGGLCGKSRQDWSLDLQRRNELPKNDNPVRPFYDHSLCCFLCWTMNASQTFANCFLNEFRQFSLTELRRQFVNLQCKSNGRPDQCQSTTTMSSRRPTITDTPEGPDVSVRSKGSLTTTTTATVPEHGMTLGSNKFTALVIVFILINLILAIVFLLVCIYAAKLEPPETYRKRKVPRQREPQSHVPTSDANGETQKPTRIAPPPPRAKLASNSLGGASSVGLANDEIYSNQWVADEVVMNEQQRQQQQQHEHDAADGKRRSYLNLLFTDAIANVDRFRAWSSRLTSRLSRDRDYVNETVIEELRDSRTRNATRKQELRDYSHDDDSLSAGGDGQQPEIAANMSDELKQKLRERLAKTKAYGASTEHSVPPS